MADARASHGTLLPLDVIVQFGERTTQARAFAPQAGRP